MEETTEIRRQHDTAIQHADAAWDALMRTIDELRHCERHQRPEAARKMAEAVEWYRSRAVREETWDYAVELEGKAVHVYRRSRS